MASETACAYACLIIHDDGIAITADKIATVVKGANLNIESYWPSLFAKLCEKKNVDELLLNVGVGGGGAAPAAVAAPVGDAGASTAPSAEENKKEEAKKESDEEEGLFGLFD